MSEKTRTNATLKLAVFPLGMSLGFFLAISFALCVGFDLLFPYYAMHESWQALLPAFTWISWGSFALGAAETFFYGWYAALLIGPIYNFFARG